MIENIYYSHEMHGPYELFDLGNFIFEEGYALRDCQLAYTTFGELSEARDNAVLITTRYSGTHQISSSWTVSHYLGLMQQPEDSA